MTKPQDSDSSMSWWQKAHTSVGFAKGYNLILFVILAGAMLGFSLARLAYLDIGGYFAAHASPGEWYWYRSGHYRVGITLHLGCILPAGLLMVWQFVPFIRRKAILFHRINGYVIILLVFVSNGGALMIVRRSFGGSLATQSAVGILVITTTVALAMAYYNVKMLQIDQHRAWMLRAMVYLGEYSHLEAPRSHFLTNPGTIITTRLIMIISALSISRIGSYYLSMSCNEIAFLYNDTANPVLDKYPACANNQLSSLAHPNSTSLQTSVHANFYGGRPEEIGAALKLSFGMAIWMSIFLHFVGTEIYLALTPAESDRLRAVSYTRQLEAGYANPGNEGLTIARFGDVGKA